MSVGDMGDGRLPSDPGWGVAVRRLFRFLLPFAWMGQFSDLRRGTGRPDIVTLRAVYLSFAASLLLLLTVMFALFPSDDPAGVDPFLAGAGVAGLGVLAMASAAWFGRRQLECAPADELAREYAKLFFVRVALIQSPALFGFAAAFLVEELWPYLIGLGLSGIGFVLNAPAASDIRRRDEQLTAQGCAHSLRAGLYHQDET